MFHLPYDDLCESCIFENEKQKVSSEISQHSPPYPMMVHLTSERDGFGLPSSKGKSKGFGWSVTFGRHDVTHGLLKT
jgi:hypothetical protein